MSEDPKHIESCRGVIKFLDNTVRNMAVYPPEHPSVSGVSRRVHDLLVALLEGREEIHLGIVNGVLYLDDYLFNESTPYSENFLKVLTAFGLDELVVTRGVTQEEVLRFAGIFRGAEHSREVFVRKAEEANLKHIGLRGSVAPSGDDPAVVIVSSYRDAVDEVDFFFKEVLEGRLPALVEAVDLVERFRKDLAADRWILLLLTSLKGWERYTVQHCVNVCLLAILLAEKEGLGEREISSAGLAGLLHDAGMVKVPREVTCKPGSLTPGERETYKSHPVHSAGILHGMGAPEDVILSVERHHVHYREGGYPPGLDKDEIPLLAGLLSVVDSYDAITAVRSYKRPVNAVQALAFLEKESGNRFDPMHVEAFRSMLGPFPPGSAVRLTSNEIGMVVRPGDLPGQPVVKMMVDEDGRICDDPWELDLSQDEVQGRMVAGVVDPALYGLAPERVFS